MFQTCWSPRQKTIADLEARNETGERDRAALIGEREKNARHIEKLEDALDTYALKAREALSSDQTYRADLKAHETAIEVHKAAKSKSERALKNRLAKGKAYESDPLFMYLWDRQFGHKAYEASNIVKWLDGKVAALINYHGARANYTVLLEIPERLADHVTALHENIASLQVRIDEREADKIRELASADVAGQLRDLRAQEARNMTEMTRVSAELSDVGEQLNQYAEGQDPAFRKAIELSAEFLSQETTATLMAISRETTTPTDDQIVSRIKNIDNDLARLDKTTRSKTQDLERLFNRRDELVRIAADFRRSHYDEPGSVFVPENIGQVLLEELLRGAISGADYWARTRRRQRWRSRPADPFRRSESFPPFDDSIFDGSWSGGSWSDGGDDFHTDGGF